MHKYIGFSDPSGGVSDSFVTSVAHQEGEYGSETIILDAIFETRAPFAPEATVAQHAEFLKRYRVGKCFGDRYGSGWVVEQWKKNDINYVPSEKNKSELYLDFLPRVTSRAVDLLDNERLIHQLVALERRTGRGRDIVDHRDNHRSHDDVANSVAGAVVHASLNRYSSQSFFPAGKPKLQHPGFADPLAAYRVGGGPATPLQRWDGLRR